MNNSSSSATDRARVKRPQRRQIEWRATSLDQLIPNDHRVRVVWAYVDSLDFSPLYRKIQAVEGKTGKTEGHPDRSHRPPGTDRAAITGRGNRFLKNRFKRPSRTAHTK